MDTVDASAGEISKNAERFFVRRKPLRLEAAHSGSARPHVVFAIVLVFNDGQGIKDSIGTNKH